MLKIVINLVYNITIFSVGPFKKRKYKVYFETPDEGCPGVLDHESATIDGSLC